MALSLVALGFGLVAACFMSKVQIWTRLLVAFSEAKAGPTPNNTRGGMGRDPRSRGFRPKADWRGRVACAVLQMSFSLISRMKPAVSNSRMAR